MYDLMDKVRIPIIVNFTPGHNATSCSACTAVSENYPPSHQSSQYTTKLYSQHSYTNTTCWINGCHTCTITARHHHHILRPEPPRGTRLRSCTCAVCHASWNSKYLHLLQNAGWLESLYKLRRELNAWNPWFCIFGPKSPSAWPLHQYQLLGSTSVYTFYYNWGLREKVINIH